MRKLKRDIQPTVATLMQQRSTHDRELERELLAQPAFAGGTLQFVRRLSARHSELLEYSFQSCNEMKSLVVKQQALGPDSERATLQEFANLGRVRTLLGIALGRSVPEPLLALPKRGILVTSKVPGVPLTVMLKKYANRLASPFHTSAIGETARRVGAWLRSFQDATPAEPFTHSTVSYLADLELRLSQFQKKGFEPGLTREILQQASLHSAPLNGRLISAAARHGDFIAQNILIEDDGVAVVDFEGFSEREAVYDDVGMFLGYILALGARAPYSPQSLDAARRGFLAGFLAGDAIDQALLNIYILKGAVRIIADGPPLTGNWSRLGTVWMLTKRLKDLASGGAI
jgi:Phosphotransferase enzyme family